MFGRKKSIETQAKLLELNTKKKSVFDMVIAAWTIPDPLDKYLAFSEAEACAKELSDGSIDVSRRNRKWGIRALFGGGAAAACGVVFGAVGIVAVPVAAVLFLGGIGTANFCAEHFSKPENDRIIPKEFKRYASEHYLLVDWIGTLKSSLAIESISEMTQNPRFAALAEADPKLKAIFDKAACRGLLAKPQNALPAPKPSGFII